MPSPLLATKLHMPAPHPKLVQRDRLLRRLTEGWRGGCRLTLVSAPAGFGKTTLVTSWLAELRASDADLDIAWLSLDEDDSDLRRFLAYVVAALATVRPGLETVERALQQTSQVVDPEPVMVSLLNALAASQVPLILVLDDYQEIRDPAIHTTLAYLVDHLPHHMHIVIATRVDPQLSLARLRLQDRLTELRAADLRFTMAEAMAFFNRVMGLDLAENDVSALEARTEGWAAGLQLAALSLRGRAPDRVRSFIEAFSGTHRHVIDYLVEEVLAQQPESLRSFMTHTSMLAQLTAPLCEAVTGAEDAADLLQRLEQSNLFIVPLDETRTWYRYHRLLAEFLQSRLQSRYPDQVADLHRRAATWYENAGMPGEAISHLLRAGETDRAADLIERSAQDLLMHGEVGVVLRWFRQLPAEVTRARTPLSMIYAEALLIAGQGEEALAWASQVEADLKGMDEPQDALISQVSAVRAYHAIQFGNLAEGMAQLERAMTHLPPDDSFLQATVMWLLGLVQYFQEGIDGQSSTLDATIEMTQSTNNQLVLGLAVYISALMQMLRGSLREASRASEQAAGDIARRVPLWQENLPPAACMIYQVRADIARERNQLDLARTHIGNCVRLAEIWGNAEVLVDSYILQARICEVQGDVVSMDRALDKVDALIARAELASISIRHTHAHRARLCFFRGDLEPAMSWLAGWRADLEPALESEPRVAMFIQWIEVATASRIALAQGHFGQVLAWVTPLLSRLVDKGWLGIAVELAAIQALAFHGQGDLPAALVSLQRALEWALPEGYRRSFVDFGAPMARLLRRAEAAGTPAADLAPLLAAIDSAPAARLDWLAYSERTHLVSDVTSVGSETTSRRRKTTHRGVSTTAEEAAWPQGATSQQPSDVSAQPPSPVAPSPELVEPLSDRELEVLRLIAAGLTNREIAERLYIAISTVKTHINNLYGKLGVSNRAQAVARANQLDLL